MARMANRTYKVGICCCPDCSGPIPIGRAGEERAWRRDWKEDL